MSVEPERQYDHHYPDEYDRGSGDGRPSQSPPMGKRPSGSEPIFNVPAVIIALAGIMVAIHVIRTLALTSDQNYAFLLYAAFIPARYGELSSFVPFPLAIYTSPVSYAFLHGDGLHLGMNLLWMLAFGTPVARRFGWVRFLVFFVITALAGALAHWLAHGPSLTPMIGASAVVSGAMGAAARFAFTAGGLRAGGDVTRLPAQSLLQSFQNPQFLVFLAVWMGLNLLFGTGIASIGDAESDIAWQAHIGGFIAGMLVFAFLDRQRAEQF